MKKNLYLVLLIIFQNTICISQNWEQKVSNTNENLNSLFFISQFKGWIVGNNGTILYTNDGGNNWNNQISNISTDLYDVFFIDSLNGFIVGNCSTILQTSNGGNTWNVKFKESTFCMNENLSIIMKDINYGCIGTNNGCTYTTTGWPNSTTPFDNGRVSNLQKIRNTDKIFLCSNNHILISDNYGFSWSSVANYSSNLGTLRSGFYINPYNFYVCNGNKLFKLENVGQEYIWIEKFSGQIISSIDFLNQQVGYISTTYGKIFKTNNGATTWNDENVNITSPLRKLQFFNDTIGYCVGDYGVILKYKHIDTLNNIIYKDTTIYNINYIDSTIYNYTDSIIYDTINVIILDENISNLTINNESIIIKNYPNPTQNKMTIESSKNISKIDVQDINGIVLKSYNVDNIIYDLNLHDLSSGIYFLKIFIGTNFIIQKIEINHQ